MKSYIKTYINYFNYGEQDFVICEMPGCWKRAVDVHHIKPKGMGGSKTKDNIENLIGLCRACHNLAHDEKITKDELQRIHLINIDSKH